MHIMIIKKSWPNGKEDYAFRYGGKQSFHLRWIELPLFESWEEYPADWNPHHEQGWISAEALWKAARTLGMEPRDLLKKMIDFSLNYRQEIQKVWIEEDDE